MRRRTSLCIMLLTVSDWRPKSTSKSPLDLRVKIQMYRPRIMLKTPQTTAM